MWGEGKIFNGYRAVLKTEDLVSVVLSEDSKIRPRSKISARTITVDKARNLQCSLRVEIRTCAFIPSCSDR